MEAPSVSSLTGSAHSRSYDFAMSTDSIRSAYEALVEGDPEPLVALMREDMEWRGRKHSWRFWKAAPS